MFVPPINIKSATELVVTDNKGKPIYIHIEKYDIILLANKSELRGYNMPRGIPTKTKLCAICKRDFIPNCPSQRICNEDHYVACPICNKPMIWNTTRAPEPCSKECKKIKLKQFYIQKYGVEHPMQAEAVQQKFKETMLDKYGVEHALQHGEIKKKASTTNLDRFGCNWGLQSPEVRQKAKNTMHDKYGVDCSFKMVGFKEKSEQSCLAKYGVKNAAQSPKIQKKIKQTMMTRYGVDHPLKIPEIKSRIQQQRAEHIEEIMMHMRQTFMTNYGVPNCFQSEEIQAKIIQTCLDKYGVSHIMQNPEIRNKVRRTMEDRYGVPWYILMESYRNNGQLISKINRKFGDALKTAGISYKFEHRIDDFSYDIRLINSPTLIEIDPTYTHNIIGCHWNDGLSKTYHVDKMLHANKAGYHCINVFDWDNWEKLIPMLSEDKIQVNAEELSVYILKESVANDFLKKYSMPGTFLKPAWHIGLVKNSTIYQMVTISRPRYNTEYTAEIVRWQSNPQYEVIGGYAKLLNFIESDDFYDIHNIVLYFDCAKQLDMDILNGMQYVRSTPPTLIWSKGKKYITERIFKRFGYKNMHTESELLSDGWLPVYNCGYKVYELQ